MEIEKKIEEFKTNWIPIVFEVTKLLLVSRPLEFPDEPYTVKKAISLSDNPTW
jgi:hypothetical protein